MHLPNSLSTKSADTKSGGCVQSPRAREENTPYILLSSGASAAAQICAQLARPPPGSWWPNAADLTVENNTKSIEMAAALDATAAKASLCSGVALLRVETGISGSECKARDEVSNGAVSILPLLPASPPSCSQTPDFSDIVSSFDNAADLRKAASASLVDLRCSFEDSCSPSAASFSARSLVQDNYPNQKSDSTLWKSRVTDPAKLSQPLDFSIAPPTDTAADVLPKPLGPFKRPRPFSASDLPVALPGDKPPWGVDVIALAAAAMPLSCPVTPQPTFLVKDSFATCQPVAYANSSQAHAAGPSHSLTPGPTPSPTPDSDPGHMNLSDIATMYECFGIPKDLSNIDALFECYGSEASYDLRYEASMSFGFSHSHALPISYRQQSNLNSVDAMYDESCYDIDSGSPSGRM
eukprot:gene30065-35034_t